jgi:uncharacterized protein YbaP (TraB family)
MKNSLARLCCCLLLLSSKSAEAQTDGQSLLWRISGKGLSSPSYLFGTMHLICPDDYVWTDAMKKALAGSQQVCFEMDMDDPDVLQGAASGMTSGEDGKQLKDYFSEGQWSRLSQFMRDSIGAELSLFQGMRPVAFEAILAMKTAGCGLPVSYEANILEEAQQAGKEIIGLETPEEQLKVLASISDDSLAASIMETADSFALARTEYAKMLEAYKRQDLPALYELMQQSRDDAGMDMGIFLDERNAKWMPAMERMMPQKPTFFAVGAGHLWGEAGVIALLRKAGYTVTAVR